METKAMWVADRNELSQNAANVACHRDAVQQEAGVNGTLLTLLRGEAAQMDMDLRATRAKLEVEICERVRLAGELRAVRQLFAQLVHCDATHMKYEVIKAHRRFENEVLER